MRKVLKSTLSLAAGAALVAGVVVTPSLSSAWGDNLGGRRSYTIDQINHGVLGNKIVLNSISDSVIGDEKNFVGARENTGVNAGADNVWNGNDITVENGKEYLIRLYVHNNNPNGLDAVSQNTRVAFNIPTTSSKQVKVNGFIFSDNASPSEYWDYVNFNSDHAFHLEYVYGSALLENNGIGATVRDAQGNIIKNGIALGDEIVTKAASEHGVQIGYDALDGKIPGCYNYASYVTIRVKAVYDNEFTVDSYVRLQGDTEWHKSINANVGDLVEFQSMYHNTDNQSQANVMVKSILPNNAEYIPGSTLLFNTAHPTGATVNQDKVVTTGINVGTYKANANAYVRYTARIVDNSLQPGMNTLATWTQAGVDSKTLQDYAVVYVNKAGTLPISQQYNVTVNYIYADTGKTAAASYTGKYESGDSFVVNSPVISGYTADQTVIRGTVAGSDLTYTVKYTRNLKDYSVKVNYIYEDGTIAAPSVSKTYQENSDYSIESPMIEGYTPDQFTVKGKVTDRNVVVTVTYIKGAEPIEEPEDPEVPETPIEEPETPAEMPKTGATALASSVVAFGSLATSAGYYAASRKALKK